MGLSLLTAPAFAAQTLTAEILTAQTNTIAEVQGSGATTPLAGSDVTVQGW